jgi:hypothetical protein
MAADSLDRQDGPHEEEVAVVVSIEEYRRPTDDLSTFAEFLLAAPGLDALGISRSPDPARTVELLNPFDGPPSSRS